MASFVVRSVLCALSCVVVAFASTAQDGTAAQLLTPATVEELIASYPEVKARADELREQDDFRDQSSGGAAWRAWAESEEASAELDAIVQAHGFQDFPTWVRVLSVTAQAYAFAESGEDLDIRLSEALARIESDPDISEVQKEMMRQQLQHSADAIAAMKPSQGNIDAVKPYVGQLGQLFEDEG